MIVSMYVSVWCVVHLGARGEPHAELKEASLNDSVLPARDSERSPGRTAPGTRPWTGGREGEGREGEGKRERGGGGKGEN